MDFRQGPADIRSLLAVPFMAIELIDENYWKGDIERRYMHEVEGSLFRFLPSYA